MGYYKLLYFALLLSICLQITHPTIAAAICRPDDKTALLEFISTFVFDKEATWNCPYYDWNNNTDCCSWEGITCNPVTGNVVGLSMSRSCRKGTSSSFSSNSSLFRLSSLQSLHLQLNLPKSTIPDEIARLTQLQTLSLLTNFIGPIPEAIGGLINLKELSLFSIYVSGHIPLFIGKLQSLQLLYLQCGLTGNIPLFIVNLPKLQILRLGYNSLTGTIPPALFTHPHLSELELNANELGGSLPPSPGSSNLTKLILSGNKLEGPIPSWLFTLPSLKTLNLMGNNLGPLLPFPKPTTTSLQEVDLAFNNINGAFPSSLLQLANISTLNLEANHLIGVVEWESLKLMGNLSSLYLSSNKGLDLKKTGLSTINFPSLESFEMKSCSLTEFPDFLSEYKKLVSLDVSDNQISGAIFKQRGWMELKFFYGSNNKITAFEFPNTAISSFTLSNNLVRGSLPNPPSSITSLLLEYNELSGEIPNLMNLKNLFFLNLSYNNFQGRIPPSEFSNDSYIGNPGLCGLPLSKLC